MKNKKEVKYKFSSGDIGSFSRFLEKERKKPCVICGNEVFLGRICSEKAEKVRPICFECRNNYGG